MWINQDHFIKISIPATEKKVRIVKINMIKFLWVSATSFECLLSGNLHYVWVYIFSNENTDIQMTKQLVRSGVGNWIQECVVKERIFQKLAIWK